MSITILPTYGREAFLDWYAENRRRSESIFDLVAPEAHLSQPIPLRHPIVFYEGHLPAFSYITLARKALGGPPADADLERLFQRGIDPVDSTGAQRSQPPVWPSRERIRTLAARWDAAVIDALATAPLEAIAQAAHTILEHEQMHHETLLYILHRLPVDQLRRPAEYEPRLEGPRPKQHRVKIPAGRATLGAERDGVEFGWDNEFEACRVKVPAFAVDAHSVTNGDYIRAVEAGAQTPPFWVRRGDEWMLRTLFEEIPLPLSWPVYVTRDQAISYAARSGGRLLREAEYHRAAYGTADGTERLFPWGAQTPDATHGTFDFERYDPAPAGAHPAGESAFVIHDLVGNGWEWTATAFEPLPGFSPLPTYPQYSADFFDGAHYVVKGASPVTARSLIRRSFRNWYRTNYPYVYAKFRCAYD
ncbi:ergothioneine biosynthesis protein EgtB [bacterium]|nr:MAG: ergothioneine biosynthesis protein EgtB [bacterium]